MSLTPDSKFIHVTIAGVAMSAVPAGVTRHITDISAGNRGASDEVLMVEVDRGVETYEIVPGLTLKADETRSAQIGAGTLIEGDIARFLSSSDSVIDVWVTYHDRSIPA